MNAFSSSARQNVSKKAKIFFGGTTKNPTKIHFLQAKITEVCCSA